jgi:hypothetical protein
VAVMVDDKNPQLRPKKCLVDFAFRMQNGFTNQRHTLTIRQRLHGKIS